MKALLSAVTRIAFALPLMIAASVGLQRFAIPVASAATGEYRVLCDDGAPLCTETVFSHNYEGKYIGHDEPALLFYSSTPGSGNSSRYLLRLPEDPPNLPKQDGTGGTFNFQLRPAFWFGMAICDSQSAPNPGPDAKCSPDTDANIFDNPDPSAADYIGKHPGTAFMELQFYPPGWVLPPFFALSCDPVKWCAALNIDSLSQNMNTGQVLNKVCREQVGSEYVNFAFITKNGQSQAAANPVKATDATYKPDPSKDLLMNSGDWLLVDIRDTPEGLAISIKDLTTGQTGSMTASIANGFGQVQFVPDPATDCNNIPYAFHPMYSTSSEHTRVPWAVHSFNIAFSDEIGHFEYCADANCTTIGVNDPAGVDVDDAFCFPASASSRIKIGGCLGTDVDFDGESYQSVWPGTFVAPGQDKKYHPSAVVFSSPLFTPTMGSGTQNYDRVAFETDLPAIEDQTSPPCNIFTGANCLNPPAGANFYPIYSTRNWRGSCVWQLGGANIPDTIDDFGGNSTVEYGSLFQLAVPVPGNTAVNVYFDFRQVLPSNPCPQDQRLFTSVGR